MGGQQWDFLKQTEDNGSLGQYGSDRGGAQVPASLGLTWQVTANNFPSLSESLINSPVVLSVELCSWCLPITPRLKCLTTLWWLPALWNWELRICFVALLVKEKNDYLYLLKLSRQWVLLEYRNKDEYQFKSTDLLLYCTNTPTNPHSSA